MTKFSGRTFLVFLTELITVFLGVFGFRTSVKGAGSGVYVRTPFIGTTRENPFQKFYINYWKPFLSVESFS